MRMTTTALCHQVCHTNTEQRLAQRKCDGSAGDGERQAFLRRADSTCLQLGCCATCAVTATAHPAFDEQLHLNTDGGPACGLGLSGSEDSGDGSGRRECTWALLGSADPLVHVQPAGSELGVGPGVCLTHRSGGRSSVGGQAQMGPCVPRHAGLHGKALGTGEEGEEDVRGWNRAQDHPALKQTPKVISVLETFSLGLSCHFKTPPPLKHLTGSPVPTEPPEAGVAVPDPPGPPALLQASRLGPGAPLCTPALLPLLPPSCLVLGPSPEAASLPGGASPPRGASPERSCPPSPGKPLWLGGRSSVFLLPLRSCCLSPRTSSSSPARGPMGQPCCWHTKEEGRQAVAELGRAGVQAKHKPGRWLQGLRLVPGRRLLLPVK